MKEEQCYNAQKCALAMNITLEHITNITYYVLPNSQVYFAKLELYIVPTVIRECIFYINSAIFRLVKQYALFNVIHAFIIGETGSLF